MTETATFSVSTEAPPFRANRARNTLWSDVIEAARATEDGEHIVVRGLVDNGEIQVPPTKLTQGSIRGAVEKANKEPNSIKLQITTRSSGNHVVTAWVYRAKSTPLVAEPKLGLES
tara:strand:+ start:2284 stop:2631 length:348 start_codon:yes stop_codon:yes gene_type:complete